MTHAFRLLTRYLRILNNIIIVMGENKSSFYKYYIRNIQHFQIIGSLLRKVRCFYYKKYLLPYHEMLIKKIEVCNSCHTQQTTVCGKEVRSNFQIVTRNKLTVENR